MKKKKGQIANLQTLIVPLVGLGIVLMVGFLIFAEVRTNPTVIFSNESACTSGTVNRGYACNATLEVTEAMEGIGNWLPIIVITVIGSILIGLVAFFRSR